MTPARRSREDFSFDARYGRLIRKAGIGTIPFALFYYQAELDLSPQEVWLIGYVLSHRWTSELPFPAVREMARRSGVTTKTIEKYKKSICEKGYLFVVRRTRADGGNTSIGWDFSPLFERIDHLITRDIEDWVKRNPQFLEEELPGLYAPVDNSVDKDAPVLRGYHTPTEPTSHAPGVGLYNGDVGEGSHAPCSPGSTLNEEETWEEQHDYEHAAGTNKGMIEDRATTPSSSKGMLSPTTSIDVPLPASPLIDRVIRDYSSLLHDAPKSIRSNCTRAKRIWAESGLTEDEFMELLHRAYRTTQDNAHRIRKSAKDGPYGTKNKMPYFFSILVALRRELDE